MQRASTQSYPEYEDDEQQSAARFLCTDIDARPMIRGITSRDRLDAWTEVAKELDITGVERRALRQRRQVLNGTDEDVTFARASETDAGDAAVADGGAVVEGEVDTDDRSETDDSENQNSDWTVGPDQEAMEYADEAEKQSKKNEKRRVVQDLIGTVEEAEDALDREYGKDVVPIHLTELLEARLEVLRGERDE